MKIKRVLRKLKSKKKTEVPREKRLENFKKRTKKRSLKKTYGLIFIILGLFSLFLLFLIKGDYLVSQGEVLSPVVKTEPKMAVLAGALKELGIEIKGRMLDNGNKIVVYLREGGEVWFSKEKNIENQAVSLQIILDKFKIKDRKIKKIDLRYSKPVVTTEYGKR